MLPVPTFKDVSMVAPQKKMSLRVGTSSVCTIVPQKIQLLPPASCPKKMFLSASLGFLLCGGFF